MNSVLSPILDNIIFTGISIVPSFLFAFFFNSVKKSTAIVDYASTMLPAGHPKHKMMFYWHSMLNSLLSS